MLEVGLTSQIANAVMEFERGGVLLFPTDCGWTIGCDATNVSAVEKLLSISAVNDAALITLLVASEKDILHLVTQPDLAVFDFLEEQSQPVSILYCDVIGIADALIQPNGEIAIRITKDLVSRSLIKRLQSPIAIHPIKSANSTHTFPKFFGEIEQLVKQEIDFIIKTYKLYENEETEVKLFRLQANGVLAPVVEKN